MSEPKDGNQRSPTAQEPEGAFLQFSLKDGRIEMTTNIPDNLARYGLWMAGQELMFRANTMDDIRKELAKPKIVRPGMAERVALGILK